MTDSQKKIALFLVLLVTFIDWMGIGLVYPMFSSLIFASQIIPPETSDATRGLYLGILLGTYPLAQFLAAPILGALSDWKGRKKLISISLILAIIGYCLAVLGIFLQSLIILIVYRFIAGIAGGSSAIAAAAIADLSTEKEKTKNFGLFNMACGVGFGVGPFLGGQLSQCKLGIFEGFSIPFLFSALVAFINLVLVYYYFRETHLTPKKNPINFIMGIKNLKKAFYIKETRILFLCVFLTTFGWSFFYEFIPVTWINEFSLSPSQIGTFFAYAAGFYALSSGLLIQPIVNRFSTASVLFFSLIIGGLYVFVMLLVKSPNWLFLYMPLQQYLIALFFPASTALVSNTADSSMQGETLGVLQSVQSSAFALSPLIAGPFLGLSLKMPIIVGAICFLLAGTIIGLSLRKEVFQSAK